MNARCGIERWRGLSALAFLRPVPGALPQAGLGLWPTRMPIYPMRFLYRLPGVRANGAPPSQPGATPREPSPKEA